MAEQLGKFVKKLLPEPEKDLVLDLDAMAKEGRQRLWMKEQVGQYRSIFRPSSLSDPCMKFDVAVRLIMQTGELPGIGKVEKVPIQEGFFDYNLQRKMDTGTALHHMEQTKYFGPLTEALIGCWRCTNCHATIQQPQLRPKPCPNRVAVVSVQPDGSEVIKNRLCKDHGSWDYVEPTVTGRINGEPVVEGHVDLPMFAASVRGKLVLVDIKSVGSDRWATIDRPVDKDVIQLKTYLWCWPAEFGILRYINMGDATQTKHWTVKRDPVVEDFIRQYVLQTNELVKTKRLSAAGGVCSKPTQARAKRCPLAQIICFPEEA